MKKQLVVVRYGKDETGWAEVLGGRLARIDNTPLFADFWLDDIVRLTHLPGEADELPRIAHVVHRRHPHRALLKFRTADEGRVLTSLFSLLGAESAVIIPTEEGKSGFLGVAYDDPLDPGLLAEAVGIGQDLGSVADNRSVTERPDERVRPTVPDPADLPDRAATSDDPPSD